MNHQHSGRYDQCLVTSHCNDRCRRSRNAVDLDCDLALVVAEHGVDLRCGEHISAG